MKACGFKVKCLESLRISAHVVIFLWFSGHEHYEILMFRFFYEDQVFRDYVFIIMLQFEVFCHNKCCKYMICKSIDCTYSLTNISISLLRQVFNGLNTKLLYDLCGVSKLNNIITFFGKHDMFHSITFYSKGFNIPNSRAREYIYFCCNPS